MTDTTPSAPAQSVDALRLCDYCNTWRYRPCGEGCVFDGRGLTFEEHAALAAPPRDDAAVRMRAALTEIYERPLPSQPMTDGGDELSWAHRQYAELRRIAKKALDAPPTVAPPAEGWRTIDTCPKDGRDFLVWNRENRIRKARWYERSSSDLGISLYDSDGVNTFKGGIQPTHWMPLPKPPGAPS